MPRDYHQTALARVSSPVARRVLDQLRQLLPAPPVRSDPEQYYADWSESLSLGDASRQYAKWLRQQLRLLNVPGLLISDLDAYDRHQHPVDEALEALAPTATSDSLEGSVEWIAGNLEDLVGPPPFLEELPLRRSRLILLLSLPALLGPPSSPSPA
ncbi:hypothetical protein IT575_06920 [bacterium]|nr:hypothetical protein [bacterium]